MRLQAEEKHTMAFAPHSLAQAVMERIADLFSERAPWPQRLWRSSSVDAVRHCIALVEGGARSGAKKYALGNARTCIEGDLFIPARLRLAFMKSLQVDAERLVLAGSKHHQVRALEEELAECYWDWIDAFLGTVDDSAPVDSRVDADVLSWQLAAHLRASGMSDAWIANFTNYHLKHNVQELSLAVVMQLARAAATNGSGWTFMVPLDRRKGFNVDGPPLLSRRDFDARFQQLFGEPAASEHRGGLEIQVGAIDKYAATEQAELALQRVMNRFRSATLKRRLLPRYEARVSPGNWTAHLDLSGTQRIRFFELDANGGSQIFSPASDELEAAIDLLIAGDRTSVRAASIASWAAIETLFADESDFGDLASVAERAADILTCLYVRDVYWSIATGHARAGTDALAAELRSADAAGRASIVEGALDSQAWIVSATLGQVSLQRVRRISRGSGVKRVHGELSAVLRRLYDIRNQIVHAGRIEPFGLQTTYASSAILLSALIDELLVQYRVHNRSARETAGRASWLVERVAEGWATPSSLASL